jgi:opacity protein-like surface antigen
MRFGRILISTTLALAAFGAATARAAEQSWMGEAYIGYAKIAEGSSNSKYSVPGGGLTVYGGAYRMLHPDMGLGLEGGYQHYGDQDYTIPGQESGKAGFSSIHLTLQALVQGTHGTTRPFGTLGAGWYSLHTTTSGELLLPDGTPIPGNHFEDKRTDSRFGANLGVGLQFHPNNSSVLWGIEARGHAIFQGWPEKDGGTGTLDAFTIAAGIHFH